MKILLLTLYYPPLNTIAATRLKAFEQNLTAMGHDVDVLTRYYDHEQRKGLSMFVGGEDPAGLRESYIREGNVIYTNFKRNNPRSRFSKLLPPGIRGAYNYLLVDNFHYGWINYMLKAYAEELQGNKYDFIVASFGPPVILIAANILARKYNIPFVIDFRDAYIDERDSGIHLWIKKKLQTKLLSKAAGLVFATGGMKDYFFERCEQALAEKPSCIVYNGVDNDIHNNISPLAADSQVVARFEELKNEHKQILLHTGTLYKEQNIGFFIETVEKHNRQYDRNVAIVFLGLSENGIGSLPAKDFIFFLDKVGRQTSLYLQQQATALLLPIWNGRYTGFSGKTQEYIFSRNFIITSPSPQKDLLPFFSISPNVVVAKGMNDVSQLLLDIEQGNCTRKELEQPEKLYRSYWIGKLSDFLHNLK